MAINEVTQELIDLRKQYENERKTLRQTKEDLKQKGREYQEKLIEILTLNIDQDQNNPRLQNFLEEHRVNNIEFLFRGFCHNKGNNVKGDLTFIKLLFLDEEMKELSLSYGIRDLLDYYDAVYKYKQYDKHHPFLDDERIQVALDKATRLSYIDEKFRDIQNILDYQGAYVVYQYFKNYLRSVLLEEAQGTDEELVLKDFDLKKQYTLDNYAKIARYLVEAREQLKGSRIALCNQGMKRNIYTEPKVSVTFDHNFFSDAVALGTTLDKLQTENYEDLNQLIFIPHQRILK